MLIPADLVTDEDLTALDGRVDDDFGATSDLLSEKRAIAVQDWLSPRLEAAGYQPWRHLTRRAPEVARQYTGAAYTDVADAVSNQTLDDLALETVFVAPATDCLYIGSREPFRGLWVEMVSTVNANTAVSSLTYWNGQRWQGLSRYSDGTVTTGKAFAGGGRLTFTRPDDWTRRAIDDEVAYYVRLQVNSPLSAATKVSQLLPIVRSRLTHPAALYALSLVYREGQVGSRGAWEEKAAAYADLADQALQVALPLCADEFDVDDDQAVSRAEASSVTGYGDFWTLERA
jgi:hypothetical protein